jgi:hypothetical protein
MLGHKQPLSNSMLGHKKPLGGSMLGHKKALYESPVPVANMGSMEEPKKSVLERRIKRGGGMNLGILNA